MSQEKTLEETNKINIEDNSKNEENPKEVKDPPPNQPKTENNTQNSSKTKLENKFAFWFRISEEVLKNQLPKIIYSNNIKF